MSVKIKKIYAWILENKNFLLKAFRLIRGLFKKK